MPNPELLKILCCPETHQKLTLASAEQVQSWNKAISARQLKNRAGNIVEQTMESALLREDGKFAYPIRDNIPIMLIDEAFSPQLRG